MDATVKPIRVVLVDDHHLVRAGLASLLATWDGIEVVGQADCAEDAFAVVATHQPDIVMMDISMRDLSGLEAIDALKRKHPGLKIVMLSMHAQEDYVQRALQSGATGYLLKGAAPAELELAMRAVARGETFLSPAVSQPVVAGYIRRLPERNPLADLTPRQRQILQALAEGQSTKEIAFRLQVSTKTVETHRAQVMERLGIRDLAGLVRFAVRHRLVKDDE